MDKMTIDASKDYYSILGVLPSIEPSALRAVYLALLKKYHPDVYKGDRYEAERITKEINEAYEILGNQEKKAEYDSQRNNNSSVGGDFNWEAKVDQNDFRDSELEKDWIFAVEYYPETENIRLALKILSKSLSILFQYIILTNKDFENSSIIASQLKYDYLNRYFGSNRKIQDFAVAALSSSRKDVALELNNVIRILGTPTEEKVQFFLNRISEKYNFQFNKNHNLDFLKINKIYINFNESKKIYFVELIGKEVIGTIDNKEYFIFKNHDHFFRNCTSQSIYEYMNPKFVEKTIHEFQEYISNKELKYFPD